jgi:hypothetical protein
VYRYPVRLGRSPREVISPVLNVPLDSIVLVLHPLLPCVLQGNGVIVDLDMWNSVLIARLGMHVLVGLREYVILVPIPGLVKASVLFVSLGILVVASEVNLLVKLGVTMKVVNHFLVGNV